MTVPRQPRPDPVTAQPAQRLRPSHERALLAAENRTTRGIAFLALVVALLGVGLAGWNVIAPRGASCQGAAWDTEPPVADLPNGWTIGTSQYDVLRKQMTLLGPVPQDQSSAQAVVYATITCYPEGATDSVTRSEQAAKAAGQVVTNRQDLGDQAFASVDQSGATFLQLRHGDVVAYLAASGDATADEVEVLASAFDIAMGGDGGDVPIATLPAVPSGSDDAGASPSDQAVASESPAAPELEAALPKAVGDVQLDVVSYTGDVYLQQDQWSRGVIAGLRALGKQPSDLRYAQAGDPSQNSDIVIEALSVAGLSADDLRKFSLDTWASGSTPGVTSRAVTLGGREVTVVDFGDEGAMEYLVAESGRMLIITTVDRDLAAAAIAALP